MRFTLRSLPYLVPIAVICSLLSLFALDKAPGSLYKPFPVLGFGGEDAYYTTQLPPINATKPSPNDHPSAVTIQSFWDHWSTIIHDARPKANAIKLKYDAGTNAANVGVSSGRSPYRNLVSNGKDDIESLKASHAVLLEALTLLENGHAIYNGTGMVVVAGGEYFGPAITGIQMLRRTGSTLPVEVFLANDEEYEAEICDNYLPRLNVRCIVLTEFLRGSSNIKVTHYQLKSLALLFSSFVEVLFIDSDSIPLLDPVKEIFTKEPYMSTGLVIWPDFWGATESTYFYDIAGIPFPRGLPATSSEAGQLLVNKRTHLKTLLLVAYYNVYGPDYYFPLLSQGALGQGDKETFLAAAVVLGMPYYRVKTGVAAVGRNDGRRHRGSGMIQVHPGDDYQKFLNGTTTDVVRPAFLHGNTPKMNAGHLVDEGDLISVDAFHKDLRLWGSKEEQEDLFGYDLEMAVWELLVQTGCELAEMIKEWKGRDRMCDRLKKHWNAVFVGHDSTRPRVRQRRDG